MCKEGTGVNMRLYMCECTGVNMRLYMCGGYWSREYLRHLVLYGKATGESAMVIEGGYWRICDLMYGPRVLEWII